MTASLARDGVPSMLGDVQSTVAEVDDLVAQRVWVRISRELRRTALAAIGEVIHEFVYAIWRKKLPTSATPSLLSAALALATVALLRRPNPTSNRARSVAGRWQVRVAGVLVQPRTKRLHLLLQLGDQAITLRELRLVLGDDPLVLLGADERHIEL